MNAKRRVTKIFFYAISLAAVGLLISGCKPAPPTPLEIQALVCEGCSTTTSNVVVLGSFQCTVTAEEKSQGITEVWAITYDPDSTGRFSANIGVMKLSGKWEKTDDNRFNCCMDERNALQGETTHFGNNCSE